MDNKEIHEWEQALDQAELSPLTDSLPEDQPAGTIYNDTEGKRKWLRVDVIRGNTGARWAYWAPWWTGGVPSRIINGPGRNPDYLAVADLIFNGDAAHFIGMLATPYVKLPQQKSTLMWVLVEPKVQPPPSIKEKEGPVKERYERSKEVYDVGTGKTEILP